MYNLKEPCYITRMCFPLSDPSQFLGRQVLLLENDINTAPFSPAVHACVPPLPWAVTAADVADPNRCVNLRAKCMLSLRTLVIFHSQSYV